MIHRFEDLKSRESDGGLVDGAVRAALVRGEGDERLRIVQDAGVLLEGAPARRLEGPQGGVQAHHQGQEGGIGGGRSKKRPNKTL